MRLVVVLALLLTPGVSAVAQTQNDMLFVKRAAELRQAPSQGSASLGALPLQTTVTRLPERSGAWIQVRTTSGVVGWIHMFDTAAVGAPSSNTSAASGALRGLTNFLNRGSAQATNNTAATSTVGIRGLTSEDLASAQPNMAALAQAEGLRQDAAQARRFAAEAELVSRTVDPLPAPPMAPTSKLQEYQP